MDVEIKTGYIANVEAMFPEVSEMLEEDPGLDVEQYLRRQREAHKQALAAAPALDWDLILFSLRAIRRINYLLGDV